jgi:AraC family transcriptional regulator of adaptative response/methylated-DNA-[protein]-cysteine methyltransferase
VEECTLEKKREEPGMITGLSEEAMYQALLRKDGEYEGQFYAAIRSTGVFCRPTCTARKPRRENVIFFPSAKDALAGGFRPCKICRPLLPAGELPPEIASLLREIERDPSQRITDQDLSHRGIEPRRVRRWFRHNHGLTFQGYQRLLRINTALRDISEGSKVIEAALESGYESLSGFQHSFRKATSVSPRESRSVRSLLFTRFSMALGPMIAVAGDEGICLLEFSDRRKLETELAQLRRHFGTPILPGSNDHLATLQRQLAEYFAGTRRTFDLPLTPQGTPFQHSAWTALRKIPYGTTRSYSEQAASLGRPTAVRAVARANGDNRIAIIIPCHRVIGADGKLSGYGGGLWRKEWLLRHERQHLRGTAGSIPLFST